MPRRNKACKHPGDVPLLGSKTGERVRVIAWVSLSCTLLQLLRRHTCDTHTHTTVTSPELRASSVTWQLCALPTLLHVPM